MFIIMDFSVRALCLIGGALLILISQPTTIAGEIRRSVGYSSVFDIVGVVDIAASTEPKNSDIITNFFTQVSYNFGVSEHGSHIAVIDVHASTEPVLSLSDGLSADAVAKAFTEIQAGEAKAGDLSSEFRSAIQVQFEGFLQDIDDREEARNVIIIITEDKNFTIDANNNTIVIRITLGDGGSDDDNNSTDINLEELEDLRRRVDELQRRIDRLMDEQGFPETCENLFLCEEEPFEYLAARDEDGTIKVCVKTTIRHCGCTKDEEGNLVNVPPFKCSCTRNRCHYDEVTKECKGVSSTHFLNEDNLQECLNFYNELANRSSNDSLPANLPGGGPYGADRYVNKTLCERKVSNYEAFLNPNGTIQKCRKYYVHACGCLHGEPYGQFCEDTCTCTPTGCNRNGLDDQSYVDLPPHLFQECIDFIAG